MCETNSNKPTSSISVPSYCGMWIDCPDIADFEMFLLTTEEKIAYVEAKLRREETGR